MKGVIPADAVKVFATKFFAVYTKETLQFDGSYKTFEWVRAYDIAKSLCVVDDKIIILHTEMPGDLSFVSIPWGMIDDGESPDVSIKRETEEETGIVFESYEKLHTAYSNIWIVESHKYYYLARNPLSFGQQQLDPGGEKIRLEYITFEQLIDFVKKWEVFRDLGDWLLREYVLPGKEEELKKLLFS